MKRKLNIAIFHLAFIYSGGGEKLVLEEARGLKKLGHEVTIYTSVIFKDRCFPDLLPKLTIKTFLPVIPHIIPERESFQILLSCILAPLIAWRFKSYDVVLAANQPSPWMAFWVKLFFGIPYVSYLAQPTRFLYPRKVDLEEGLIFSKKRRFSIANKLLRMSKPIAYKFDRLSIRKSNAILTNGEYMRKIINKVYKVKAISCPAGAYPVRKIRNYESRSKKPYILITNRHFPQKRFEYAIMALPSILRVNGNITLVITGGETYYTNDLKRLTEKLSLSDRVKFLGLVKESELSKLYIDAACYVYTAPEEDFGMGVIEAMAHGTCVVAWDNAGPSYIIKNNETGLLAKPFEVSDFAQKIISVISRLKLSERISKKAWEEVKKKYSFDAHNKCIEGQLLNSIK